MTTFADLINEVYLELEGWGLDTGRAEFLNGSITSGALTATVDSTANLSAGLAEMEDELVYIQSASGTTVTFAPDGRGYRGTTAASHGDNVRITMNPVVPRTKVKRAINDTLKGVYPRLRGKTSTEITPTGYVRAFELPADCEQILQLTYQASGPTGIWPAVTHYDVDFHADTTSFPSGKSLLVIGPFEVGNKLRVTYLKRPSELSADGDLLTDSGLEESARALVVAGALWRLSSYYPLARMRTDSTAIDFTDQQSNTMREAQQVAALLRAQYETELSEELRRQDVTQIVPIHWKE